MIKKKQNPTKDRLLKLYKKENPSYLTIKKIQIKRRTDIIQKLLNFPLRFFKGLEVGDIACGTGEYAIIAAKNAAKPIQAVPKT